MSHLFTKETWRQAGLSALILAFAFAVTALSAFMSLGLYLSDLDTHTTVTLTFAILTLTAWVCASFLLSRHNFRYGLWIAALLWGLCFLAFLLLAILPSEESGIRRLISLFTLPAWSLAALVDPVSGTGTGILLPLLFSFLLTALPVSLLFYVSSRGKKKTSGRKKARK